MDSKDGRVTAQGIRLHEASDFDGMRKAGRIAAQILDDIAPHVFPGQTTGELDRLITEMVVASGAISATIGYRGYQHASCISLNHVVCHGIPGAVVPSGRTEKKRSDDVIRDGDILNIDVTVIENGWFGDSSRMYIAGTPKPFAMRLIEVTHEALMRGIEVVKPGNTFGDIGHAIQSFVEAQRMSVVRDFCGHGIGQVFHSAPNVLHYGKPGRGAVLEEGMFFTIEPMINLGRPETRVLADEWTAITRDKSLSAQLEHSVGVTANGVEIFTLSPGGIFYPTWS